MAIRFSKYHGTGNDFILVDGRTLRQPLSEGDIAGLCHRRFGVGADGLIVLDTAEGADYVMQYFNADGRLSSMCGNGARCAFLFARTTGLAADRADFLAYDGVHSAQYLGEDRVRISMRDVPDVMQRPGDVFVLDTGSPHYVQFVSDLDAIDARVLGKAVRNSPEFVRDGINVNFAQQSDNHVRVRTYERGVEDLTLSCGTGVTAVALASALRNALMRGPVHIETDGGKLTVDFTHDGSGFTEIFLAGPGMHVFDGAVEL